jgi:hypothetical protein
MQMARKSYKLFMRREEYLNGSVESTVTREQVGGVYPDRADAMNALFAFYEHHGGVNEIASQYKGVDLEWTTIPDA